jgi:HAD superfamily hydrolase (TIGR01509 family)
MAIKAVLFDLDGTLIDTELAAAHAVEAWFKKKNLVLDPADAQFVIGRTWNVLFDRLFAKVELSALKISREEAAREILLAYRATLEEELPTVAGASDAVKALAGHYTLGLVSGSYRAQILWALEKLKILAHFQVVLGAEDYPESKPAPDGYIAAMNTLAVKPSETLIFEDSHAGISSGLAAGARVVAITGTNHFQQNTQAAHHHIPDLRCVTADWVRNLKKE